MAASVLDEPRIRLDTGQIARALVLVLFFIVPAGNAIVPLWSGLLPTLALAPLIVLLSSRPGRFALALTPRELPALLALVGLMLVAAVSAFLVDPRADTWMHWAGSYLSPVLLYVAVRSVELGARTRRHAWSLLTLGALLPLAGGVLAYYREWGIPSGAELIVSRYALERMAGYMTATFGNTSNTAALLALLVPAWLAWLVASRPASLPRWLALAAVTVGMANVLIVQSRTLLVVLLVFVPLVLWFHRVRFTGLVVLLMLTFGALLLPALDARDELLEHTVGAVSADGDDGSVSERKEAMWIGLGLLEDHPVLGVGPGNSATLNPYTTAHQFWIHQGAEIGVAGLVFSVGLSLAVFARFAAAGLRSRRRQGQRDEFLNLVGPAAFMLYGVIANMTLAMTVVNAWVGTFAMLLALATVRKSGTG